MSRRLPAGRACSRRLYKKQMFKTNSGGIRRHSRKQCGIEKERKTARLQYLSACLSAQLPHKARPAAAGACRALQQGQHTRNCGKRTDAATLDSSDWQKLRKKKLFAAACARIFQINASPTRKLPLFCGYPLLSFLNFNFFGQTLAKQINVGYNIKDFKNLRRRIEEVITSATRNRVVGQPARGFESHRLRQRRNSTFFANSGGQKPSAVCVIKKCIG